VTSHVYTVMILADAADAERAGDVTRLTDRGASYAVPTQDGLGEAARDQVAGQGHGVTFKVGSSRTTCDRRVRRRS
jgi:hypothetical protein